MGLPSGLFPSGFPNKTLYMALLSPINTTCPVHHILLDITRTILGEEYRLFSSSLCSFLHSPVTSSLLGPNNLLSTLFSDTLRLQCTLYKNSAFASQITHSPQQMPYKYRNNQCLLLHSNTLSGSDENNMFMFKEAVCVVAAMVLEYFMSVLALF